MPVRYQRLSSLRLLRGAAIQAADLALMSDEVSKVPYAISMGRRIDMRNIAFSL